MNKALLEPSYILHARDYRESSLLLRVFSLHHGRLDLVARGAKRRNNRDRHLYQPWQRLLLSWRQRAELGTLTGIELERCPQQRAQAGFLQRGFYLNEILLHLLHSNEPCTRLFRAYENALLALDQEPGPAAPPRGGAAMLNENAPDQEPGPATPPRGGAAVLSENAPPQADDSLRYFEKHLLQELGYSPILDHRVDDNGPLRAAGKYFYAYEQGPREVCGGNMPNQEGQLLSGQTLLALHNETLGQAGPQCRREARRLLRALLQRQLGHRQLFSRALYQAWPR